MIFTLSIKDGPASPVAPSRCHSRLQGLGLAGLGRPVRLLNHLDDLAGVLAGRHRPLVVANALDQVTDRKSLLALRGVARSLKPKACVSMGAE
jgi:hypothetical protein